jgi:hypothetical protein
VYAREKFYVTLWLLIAFLWGFAFGQCAKPANATEWVAVLKVTEERPAYSWIPSDPPAESYEVFACKSDHGDPERAVCHLYATVEQPTIVLDESEWRNALRALGVEEAYIRIRPVWGSKVGLYGMRSYRAWGLR